MQQKETIEQSSEIVQPVTKKQSIISRAVDGIFSLFKHIPFIPLKR